ncbi:hypothetical protein EDB81DRAFT_905523 [Dactylonectria macrodidyma]|uniref:Uncharacterized protein n=1 Tax=Dactylonectria macrodidyma TaxID=307937 RepID=A0A9P9E590_9HYPO|nr:hypothetical protein EDB81DRAFT_905523 [Dactylonectria macrodidyma]
MQHVDLATATGNLPGVLSEWVRPLANLSELNLFMSTASRLVLKLSHTSDWRVSLSRISQMASQYEASVDLSEWQARFSNMSAWAALLAAILFETELQYYSAISLFGYALAVWSNISVPERSWLRREFSLITDISFLNCSDISIPEGSWLKRDLPKLSELEPYISKMNISSLTGQLSNYTDRAKRFNATAIANKIAGRLAGLSQNLTNSDKLPSPQVLTYSCRCFSHKSLPGMGLGGAAPAVPALPAAQPARAEISQMGRMVQGDMPTLPGQQGEISLSNLIMKGIEEFAVPIMDATLD